MFLRTRPLPLALSVALLSCVETKAPPNPTAQAAVPYGPKIYLADHTLGNLPLHCRLVGAVTSTGASTKVGGTELLDLREAHNCFVNVDSGMLNVDLIEVTNDMFQLCVDSGVCERPDPGSVEKGQICNNPDRFGSCPVVSVQQFEAARYCEFVGRRLPTGIEHLVMRQPTQPQSAEAVAPFPTGATLPSNPCPSAVLASCNGPIAMEVPADAAGTYKGGAAGDRTAQGVYDLTGNVAEWSSDLIPALRPTPLDALPWFCERPLPTGAPGTPPTCPDGDICIHGRYDPDAPAPGTSGPNGPLPVADWPVCVASRLDPPRLSFTSGSQGSVFGGNYKDAKPSADEAGTFARRLVNEPDKDPADAKYGFRCVGLSGMTTQNVRPRRGTQPTIPDAGTSTRTDAAAPDLGADAGLPDVGLADTGTIADAG